MRTPQLATLLLLPLLVGCTEFSLLADELKGKFTIVDSLDVLVEATVSFSLEAEV